ncbi:MAG: helix-turn-helix domain-containing protein [Sedimentisphaerales bacterium]|nr:helix-turn-helix domain-containing protein [Sedimentisphaerales bacterium]
MVTPADRQIIHRFRLLRQRHAGKRGKSLFAKELGISPSTYNYYERDRVAPAGVLYRACQLTGESIEWLLTGRRGNEAGTAVGPASGGIGPEAGQGSDGRAAGSEASAKDLPERVRRLTARDPKARAAIESFLDLLEATERADDASVTDAPYDPGPPQAGPSCSESPSSQRTWLPILGRSAAGLVHFWPGPEDRLPDITELTDLIRRHLAQGHRRRRFVPDTSLYPESGEPLPDQACLVQLSEAAENGISEFIDAPDVLAQYPDAFALRIDGDSMAPRIADGDIVVLSPTRSAREGETAIVKLKGQIGVTCKIVRHGDGQIHLIAANEAYETKSHDESSVEWALAVLWRIRIQRHTAPPPPATPTSHDN